MTIYKYYFPLGTSKFIFYDQIDKISLEDATLVNTIWGVSRANLNNWFHFDKKRKGKMKFLSI
jgi:hypothetical protein